MILIKNIEIKDTSVSIKFSIDSRFRKKGCHLLATIMSSIVSDNLSIEVSIESSWIENTTKELEKSNTKPIEYFVL